MIDPFLRGLESVFGWLLEASWQASALAALVLLLQWALRGRLNPRWHHALWLLVIVRLLLPVLPDSAVSLFQFAPPPPSVVTLTMTEPIFPPMAPMSSPVLAPEPSPLLTVHSISVFTILALIWLVGALVLFLLTWQVNRRFARHVGAAPEITDPRLLALANDARDALEIRQQLRIIGSANVQSPAIMGLFHPTLILPDNVRARFTDEELRFIFLHEFAHLKRGDLFLQWLIALLQIAHWFNPALWYAFRRMRIDREPATDALVLSHTGEAQKESYGQVLVKLLEHYHTRHAFPTLVGILEDKDQFKRRFTLITNFTRGAYGWSLLGVIALAVLAAVCLTKSRVEAAADNAVRAAKSESDATSLPQVTLIVSGKPYHPSTESQQKLARQVEAIVRSSEIGPIGPIIRSIQVDYGPDQIKATGSYLHIVYPPNRYPVLGKGVSPVKEIFLGLFDNPTEILLKGFNGGSWPGYPGSIALVTPDRFPFSSYSARSSADNGDLLIALGLNPDLHPYLTAKMQATVDSVYAAQKGNVAALKNLVAHGIDLKSISGPEGSLLCYATTPEMAEYLLQQGIPVDAKDNQFQPALIHLCLGRRRDRPTIAPVITVLLKHGADPNSAMMGDGAVHAIDLVTDGPTVDALVAAGAQVPPLGAWPVEGQPLRSLDYYQALVRHGLDLKAGPWRGSQGQLLLLRACGTSGREDLVEWLIDQGVDPNGVYYRGDYPKGLPRTPLEEATSSGSAKAEEILIQHGAKGYGQANAPLATPHLESYQPDRFSKPPMEVKGSVRTIDTGSRKE